MIRENTQQTNWRQRHRMHLTIRCYTKYFSTYSQILIKNSQKRRLSRIDQVAITYFLSNKTEDLGQITKLTKSIGISEKKTEKNICQKFRSSL
jgi:hypothetical protein